MSLRLTLYATLLSPPYGVTPYGAVPTGCHVVRPKVVTSVHFIRDIRYRRRVSLVPSHERLKYRSYIPGVALGQPPKQDMRVLIPKKKNRLDSRLEMNNL